MAKIGLLVPNNLWFCPFVSIYTHILDELGVKYEIIYWNRHNDNDLGNISYNGKIGSSNLSKLYGYWKFSRFIKNQVSSHGFSGLIVFTSQIGLFCSKYLKKNFKNKYIFDYRDLSIEQNPIFSRQMEEVLSNSFANVISSPGFKKCLPSNHKYYISHNFNIDAVEQSINNSINQTISNKPLEVLTIGGIRLDMNEEIIDALGNMSNINLKFVGKGPASQYLESYAKNKDIKNISFEGYYKKNDEPEIVRRASFLNIYYPNIITHQTALSNRFYNSIIYHRPMIVTKGQIQGDYCEKYNLGIAISNTDNLSLKLQNWLELVDFSEYQNRCKKLLKDFLDDYDSFKMMLKDFIDNCA